MVFYTGDLYKKVIQDPSNYLNKLKIISGFASSGFLRKVTEELPGHKICLIIGMASAGISLNDHKAFRNICTENPAVEVFYKYKSPPNHMKVYQWYKDDTAQIAFTGSANFSHTGFFENEEILSPVIDVFTDLIDQVLDQSVSCLDVEAEFKIPIYEGAVYINEDSDISSSGALLDKNIPMVREDVESRKDTPDLKTLLINNIQLTPYNHTSIELMLQNDSGWKFKALNNWNRKSNNEYDSYIDIERTNRLGLKKLDFFPRNTDIRLISDDEEQWIVRRSGEYGRELRTAEGISFYDYFRKRMNITERRPISYKDLLNYGRTGIGLYKLSDSYYLLDFSVI